MLQQPAKPVLMVLRGSLDEECTKRGVTPLLRLICTGLEQDLHRATKLVLEAVVCFIAEVPGRSGQQSPSMAIECVHGQAFSQRPLQQIREKHQLEQGCGASSRGCYQRHKYSRRLLC